MRRFFFGLVYVWGHYRPTSFYLLSRKQRKHFSIIDKEANEELE